MDDDEFGRRYAWVCRFRNRNGILNAVASAHGRDDTDAIKKIVSSGFFILSIVAAGIIALFLAFYSFVPWHETFNIGSLKARSEVGPTLAVLVLSFAPLSR